MKDLFRAMKAKWDSAKGDQSPQGIATGGIHLGRAPKGTRTPYVVISLLGGTIDRMFGGTRFDGPEFQITIIDEHGGDMNRSLDLDGAIFDLFNDEVLPLIDGNEAMILRGQDMPRSDYDDEHVLMSRDWMFERYVP